MLKENIEQRRNTGISFIINAHKERGVLVPALKSVLLAAKECKQANIETEIILVADKVDSVTKNIIQSWRQHIDFVDFVEFGNLGLARNHALNLATKDYFCFLDGDDIWQKEWPAKAYFFAQANDPLNTVFHTELFVSFGDHYEVRKQIQTTDPLFHPTHLAISWHFCNNLFAHRNVFERVPLMPYDHSKGFGSEDWHWSCETLAVGIRRIYVPETAYFYRIDNSKQSLGKTQNLVLRKSKLFSESKETAYYPLRYGTDKEQVSFLLKDYNLKKSQPIPLWLSKTIKNKTELDYSLFTLYEILPNYQVQTQSLYPLSSSLFAQIRQLHDDCGQFSVVIVNEKTLNQETRSRLHFFLSRQCNINLPLILLCEGVLINDAAYSRFSNVLVINIQAFWHESGGNKYTLNQVLMTAISNFPPYFIFNYNHWYGETIAEDYKVFLSYHKTPCMRYYEESLYDLNNTVERKILSSTLAGENAYNIAVVDELIDIQYINYLTRFSHSLFCIAERLDISELDVTVNKIIDILKDNQNRILQNINKTLLESNLDKLKREAANRREISLSNYAVSIILNVHREGKLLTNTLNSLHRMLFHSLERGLNLELLLVLDDSDDLTRAILSTFVENIAIPCSTIEVAHKNLSLARNSGAAAAQGSFLCFLDADDLYSKNWVVEAYGTAKRRGSKAIVHSEVNIYFGTDNRVFKHYNSADIAVSGLLFENYWTSLSFASKDVYLNHLYEPLELDNGFGFEDWHWNMETLSENYQHVIAPKTAHFIRLKQFGSLNQASAQRNVIPKPTALYKKLLFS